VRAALVAGVALALLCTACDDRDDLPRVSGPVVDTAHGTATPYGTGATRVWVLRPKTGETSSVVVYLHGYGANVPFYWHLELMDHLLEKGSTVMFPEFQPGGDDPFILTPYDLEAGLKTGFRALRYDGEPIVAAGFSLGATLAFVYAAHAEEWGVPAPRTVYSIFPVDPILVDLSLDLSTIEDTRALILVGDRDEVVGQEGGHEILRGLTGLSGSLKHLRLIRSTDHLFVTHDSPTYLNDPEVKPTFWVPLDRLVEDARAEAR
jgi:pimeloyl-ACP methyl ester carboxylesterase